MPFEIWLLSSLQSNQVHFFLLFTQCESFNFIVSMGNFDFQFRFSQIQAGDKLGVSGETVRIESGGVLGGLSRLLASQSRHATLSWLSQFAASVQATSDLLQVARVLFFSLSASLPRPC